MPSFSIPRRFRAGLAAVDDLTDDEVAVLAERLDASVPEVSFETLAEPVRDSISSDIDLAQLLEAVASLNTLLPDDGTGAEALARDASGSQDLGVDEERQESYAATLERLMRIPALVLAAHATEVVAEHDKLLHEVRIFTDMRPVFERDPSTGVKMASLVAMMKLDFHPGGRGNIESVSVALDRADLEYVGRVVKRALDKMDALTDLMTENGVPRWTWNFHDHGPA